MLVYGIMCIVWVVVSGVVLCVIVSLIRMSICIGAMDVCLCLGYIFFRDGGTAEFYSGTLNDALPFA